MIEKLYPTRLPVDAVNCITSYKSGIKRGLILSLLTRERRTPSYYRSSRKITRTIKNTERFQLRVITFPLTWKAVWVVDPGDWRLYIRGIYRRWYNCWSTYRILRIIKLYFKYLIARNMSLKGLNEDTCVIKNIKEDRGILSIYLSFDNYRLSPCYY